MNFLSFGNMFRKQLLTSVELLKIGLVNREILPIELHLTHVHNKVRPLYNEVNLCPLFLLIPPKCP